MKNKTKLLNIFTAIAAILSFQAFVACGYFKGDSSDVASTLGDGDIVTVATSDPSFSTLVAAVKAADLVETLKGKGPFTVFAPNDEAFAKLPKGTLTDLLKPENKDRLVAILTYHVVPGKVMASDVKPGQVGTVNGAEITVKTQDGKVMVNNATVIKTDVETSNGVIHVIDQVILPPSS